MSENLVIDTRIEKGAIHLRNLPFKDNLNVKVVIIPTTNLQSLSFKKTRILLQEIPNNLSDDIIEERISK